MISGHHHISMFTKDLKENNHFYTEVMGLRRVKISVNQGDVKMYHVFYGDTTGSPGNDLTFFEIQNIGQTHRGTDMISAIGLLVPSRESLDYWQKRFDEFDVEYEEIGEMAGKDALRFKDPDGLELVLLNHEGGEIPEDWEPWQHEGVAPRHHILGMGTVEITVGNMESIVNLFVDSFEYSIAYSSGGETLLQSVEGEVFGEILIRENAGEKTRTGRGSVHHLAIQSKSMALDEWDEMLKEKGYATTGVKDRYYFESLYFREENGIMFEIVGPEALGFTADSSVEELGQTLDLPPFIEDQREEIEENLKPIEEWT